MELYQRKWLEYGRLGSLLIYRIELEGALNRWFVTKMEAVIGVG